MTTISIMTESYQQHVEEVMPNSSNTTLNEMDVRRSFIWKIVVTVGVATLCLIGSSGKIYSTKYISGIKPIVISTTHLAAYSYVTKKLGDACSAHADCFTEFCEPLSSGSKCTVHPMYRTTANIGNSCRDWKDAQMCDFDKVVFDIPSVFAASDKSRFEATK